MRAPVLTVVFCSRDGSERLPGALRALAGSEDDGWGGWQVLVVDNGSTDGTGEVAAAELRRLGLPGRVVRHEQPGLSFARQRGIDEAGTEWVAFVDDDLHPGRRWLSAVRERVEAGPECAIYGAAVVPVWLGVAPEGIERLLPFLGCCLPGPALERYDPGQGVVPIGGGLVVPRAAWLRHVPRPDRLLFLGRVPGSPFSGEDIECGLHLVRAGVEAWHDPAMVLHHQMPPWRTEAGYLRRLTWAAGLSSHHLRRLRWAGARLPWWMAGHAGYDAGCLAASLVRAGSDHSRLVATCLRGFRLGCLVSPAYLRWWTRWRRPRLGPFAGLG